MKNAKTKSLVTLLVVAVLTIAVGIVGVTGMPLTPSGEWKLLPWLPTTDADNWPEALSLGLDLRGGVYVEYSASVPQETEAEFSSMMNGTIAIIQQRLTDRGYAESTVQTLGSNGIRVEIPGVSDTQAVLDLIGEPALLEFRDPDGNTFMNGSMVEVAQAAYDQESSDYYIHFKLNSEGTQIFSEMTRQNVGKALSIYLDGEMLMNPTVNEPITGGVGSISGGFTREEAINLAAQIQSGALPLNLTQQKVDNISATLGDEALSSSVLAAVIGILLVMAIMIWRYRLNGVVASWSLTIYIILLFLVLANWPGIQLTLPGLAGIVLGIGMAVDANVVIFERFNEEIRNGKSLKAAVRGGFKNALSAVIDANVTTIIAAVVLMFFGTGPVQGFGTTLLAGVLVSLLTAVVVTRFLMNSLIRIRNWDVKCFTSGIKIAKEGK